MRKYNDRSFWEAVEMPRLKLLTCGPLPLVSSPVSLSLQDVDHTSRTMSKSSPRSSPPPIHSLCRSSRRSPKRPLRLSNRPDPTGRHTDRHNGIETPKQTTAATEQQAVDAGEVSDERYAKRHTTVTVSLPSFREAFSFALSDIDEPSSQSDLEPPRPSSSSSLPGSHIARTSESWSDTAESDFTFGARSRPRPRFAYGHDAASKLAALECWYAGRSFSAVNLPQFDAESMLSDSSGDYETDYTRPSSSAHSEWSYKSAVSPLNRPGRLPPDTSEARDPASPLSTVGRLSISSPPPPPNAGSHVRDPFSFQSTDHVPVSKKARSMRETTRFNARDGPSPAVAFPLFPSFGQPSATHETATTQWPQASSALPRERLRSERPPTSDAPGQEWEDYTMKQENSRDYYQCLWREGGPQCYYHAKKQAMKRHVELTHLRYRPHKCHLCDRSYGQRTSLKVHLATHTGDKDYVCPEEDSPKATLPTGTQQVMPSLRRRNSSVE
ncbi:hypothetical protein LshimejAT787_1002680 [Lyophyllum shimeji]|uniref:C2H2-type domain-containing protein n=1 Tax=Lyophyllum shimeji TaxID=47721 RepID=A0A9P3PTC2_LYOSH|nr:hypothetical protein LshimejAT787_1002680 [Lyophyllum shimeji]